MKVPTSQLGLKWEIVVIFTSTRSQLMRNFSFINPSKNNKAVFFPKAFVSYDFIHDFKCSNPHNL